MIRSRRSPLQRISPREAAALIPSGARIAVSGFCSMGLAKAVMDAMIARHEQEGAPNNLTVYHAAGHSTDWGCDSMAKAGLISKIVGGHWGLMHSLRQKMINNEIEAHNWPQGMIVRAFREMARGNRWGFLSRIGLGTFIDPRDWGGCMNEKARTSGSMLKLETAPDGSEALHYPAFPIDFALIRGWSADARGNVSLGKEPLSLSQLDIALATRAQGGKVICQIRREDLDRYYSVCETSIPHFLIDYLVLADAPSENHRQCEAYDDDDALLGGGPVTAAKSGSLPKVPEGPRGWIGRRAAMEIQPGDIFNLGIGIPGDTVTAALEEAGRLHLSTPTLEAGAIGGVGVGGNSFGTAINPEARLDQGAMFDFYHGGGLDITVMGAAEIDQHGDINVSLFNGRPTGCGGFIDITQSTPRVVFCSTFTAGDLDIALENGQLRILREGKHRKFVNKVQQITFSAQQAIARGLRVKVVTERCVFELGSTDGRGHWVLTEIAPGIDLHRDILAHIDFCPVIAPALKTMDTSCFQ